MLSLCLVVHIYNFALTLDPSSFSTCGASLFAQSRINFRCIFPDWSFGTSLTKATPPTSCLCLATFVFIQSWICFGVTLPLEPSCRATYALGYSSSLIVTPTAAASAISSCSSRTASSSAGATCSALTLISCVIG